MSLDGVLAARASYREGQVVVEYDPARVTPAQIAGAINTQTYFIAGVPVAGAPTRSPEQDGAATGATAVIKVEGMTEGRAVSLVTQAIGAVGPAIADVSFDTGHSTITVTYDPDRTSPEELANAISRSTPYTATLLSTTEAPATANSLYFIKYAVWGIAGLFVAALAWSGLLWGRRQLARAAASRAGHPPPR